MGSKYTIGLDFGTLSGRGVLVRCNDGMVLASAVKEYAHGAMDRILPDNKTILPVSWCLEYPDDYLQVIDTVVPLLLRESGVKKEEIIGIGIDFTSCTILPVDKNAVPLCEKSEFEHRRNAYAKLWKHHGAQKYADKINYYLAVHGMAESYRFGGKISPELFLPKVMEMLEEDPEIYDCADEILEAGDWVTRVLTGSHKRSCSMAGYKAWWNEKEGYPEADFYKNLNRGLDHFIQKKAGGEICALGDSIGELSEEWAEKLGLVPGIPVAPAVIDSHAGVPGSGIWNERQVMLVLGTSSVMVALSDRPFSGKGVYGGVKDAIVPGYYALESGLAAVGDMFGWFTEHMVPAEYMEEAVRENISVHELLSRKARLLMPGQTGLMALDWWNGNKTPFVDGDLSGVLLGMTLQTKPEEIYRALIEATAFGTKRILDLYEENGVCAEEVIVSGGIAAKNPFMMQVYSDVLGKRLKVADSTQTAALGSAVYASLAAGKEKGGYDCYADAVRSMCKVKEAAYVPQKENTETYKKLYEIYCELGELLNSGAEKIFYKLKQMKFTS